MGQRKVTEKELKVIEEIAKNRGITQRELSKRAEISLGMVNITLKKLAKRGYVKVRSINKRSLEYILTPKGFAEKAKKSYSYFRATLASLRQMKSKIQALILEQYSRGERKFVILGNGELADIVELSFRGLNKEDLVYKRVRSEKELEKELKEKEVVVLASKKESEKIPQIKRWINLMEKITG